jgi:hypothetical protein
VALVGGAFYYGAKVSLDAEITLHGLEFVLDLLGNFLESNGGRWPKSWDELTKTAPSESNSMFIWPDDLPKVRKRVRINFDLTTTQVASQDEEHFTAVESIGPYYPPFKESIRGLLTIARRFSNRKN